MPAGAAQGKGPAIGAAAGDGGLAEVVTFGARFFAELGQKRLMRAYFETKVT